MGELETCPDCRGNGVEQWSLKRCATCNGSGRIPAPAAPAQPKCKVCNDTGWNHHAQHGESKPGYKSIPCTFCPPAQPAQDERRQVWVDVGDGNVLLEYRWFPDPALDGTGCWHWVIAMQTQTGQARAERPPVAAQDERGAFEAHCRSVMLGVIAHCQPKPQSAYDDPTEYHGGMALEELQRCADILGQARAERPTLTADEAEILAGMFVELASGAVISKPSYWVHPELLAKLRAIAGKPTSYPPPRR